MATCMAWGGLVGRVSGCGGSAVCAGRGPSTRTLILRHAASAVCRRRGKDCTPWTSSAPGIRNASARTACWGGWARAAWGRSIWPAPTAAVRSRSSWYAAELADQQEFRDRFRQEVRAARRVGSAWTAPVLDADTEAAVPWVATGYVAGPSLQATVSGRVGATAPGPGRTVRCPSVRSASWAAGLAHALPAIHSAGLIHRDLKPSNILLTIDGPRVIDFGIARALDTVTDGGSHPHRLAGRIARVHGAGAGAGRAGDRGVRRVLPRLGAGVRVDGPASVQCERTTRSMPCCSGSHRRSRT